MNIENYSKQDLIHMFGLKPNYTMYELEEKTYQLFNKLIHQFDKKQVDIFLEKAKYFLTPVQQTPFIYTQSDNYFKGELNPIEKRVITRGICIDTLFRPNYFKTSSTDFMYEFPEHFKNVVSMKISAIEIPIVWYLFSTERKNNIFLINTIPYIIPDGNYDNESIVALMNGTGITDRLLPLDITVSIDPATTKMTFTSLITFTLDFSVDSVLHQKIPGCPVDSMMIYQTAGWQFGFRKEKYSGTIITSESSWGSSADNYFFLEIDDFQRNFISDSIVSVTNSGYIGKNIIARIPISTSYNTITLSNDSDNLFKTRDYLGPVRLEKLHIRLLNRFGNVIDLNHNDYSFMIELKQLFS
jgi:hypothetical protein